MGFQTDAQRKAFFAGRKADKDMYVTPVVTFFGTDYKLNSTYKSRGQAETVAKGFRKGYNERVIVRDVKSKSGEKRYGVYVGGTRKTPVM